VNATWWKRGPALEEHEVVRSLALQEDAQQFAARGGDVSLRRKPAAKWNSVAGAHRGWGLGRPVRHATTMPMECVIRRGTTGMVAQNSAARRRRRRLG
jgi:hypothetical protein